MMKISVIMIDGGFRENVYGTKYFSEQDLAENEYEIIWVDYYDSPHKELVKYPKVNVVTLNRTDEYHSSYCFNKGIELAKGEVLVIPDADQIAMPSFLRNIWEIHSKYDRLVNYVYRYDEIKKGSLKTFNYHELEKKCVLKNPTNYGGCLTVRRKWLVKINGYEMHPIFKSGFHANGRDLYTRFKNLGLAIQWDRRLKLFHPWHFLTRASSKHYEGQRKIIEWRRINIQYMAINGMDSKKNEVLPDELNILLYNELRNIDSSKRASELREKNAQKKKHFLFSKLNFLSKYRKNRG